MVTSQMKPGMQMATVGGKQTIVINKPGGGHQQILTAGSGQQIIRTAGGQQIIVVTTAGGMKTVQQVSTSQAGAGEYRQQWRASTITMMTTHPCSDLPTLGWDGDTMQQF